MDSFFFNISNNTKYKTTKLFEENNNHITRVDISNGIVFFNIDLEETQDMDLPIKGLDRMVMISSVQEGEIKITDKISESI